MKNHNYKNKRLKSKLLKVFIIGTLVFSLSIIPLSITSLNQGAFASSRQGFMINDDSLPENTLAVRAPDSSQIPGDDDFFGSGVTAGDITQINFADETPPENCPNSVNVGVAPNEASVVLCFPTSSENSGGVAATFYASNGVKANPNSSYLFAGIGQDSRSDGTVEINWNNFDTTPITDMNHMFYKFGCSSTLTAITLPAFPSGFGSNATLMNNMFDGFASASDATTILIPDFPEGFGSIATNMTEMFRDFAETSSATTVSFPAFPAGFGFNATDMSFMFTFLALNSQIVNLTIDLSLVVLPPSSNYEDAFGTVGADSNQQKLCFSSKTDYELLTSSETDYNPSEFGGGTYYVPSSPTIDTNSTTDSTISFNKVTKEDNQMLDVQGYDCSYKETAQSDYKQCELVENSNEIEITKLQPDTLYSVQIQTKALVEGKDRLSVIPESKDIKTKPVPTPTPTPEPPRPTPEPPTPVPSPDPTDLTPVVKKYKISFNANGGKIAKKYLNQSVENNKYAIKPPNPTKKNYSFAGWFSAKKPKSTDKQFDFKSIKITKNISLYALWVKTSKTVNLTKTKQTAYIRPNKKISIKIKLIVSGKKIKGKNHYNLSVNPTLYNIELDGLPRIQYRTISGTNKANAVVTVVIKAKKKSIKPKLKIKIGSKTYIVNIVII